MLHCSKVMKIVGANGGGAPISSCEQSNVDVTSWTPIQSLPTILTGLAMITLLGKAYVLGGIDGVGSAQSSVHMYDGVSVWVAKAAMSASRFGHAVLELDNDRALVCGGYAPLTVVNTCVIYTASTDTWTTAPAMAQARNYFNLVMSEGMWH